MSTRNQYNNNINTPNVSYYKPPVYFDTGAYYMRSIGSIGPITINPYGQTIKGDNIYGGCPVGAGSSGPFSQPRSSSGQPR